LKKKKNKIGGLLKAKNRVGEFFIVLTDTLLFMT